MLRRVLVIRCAGCARRGVLGLSDDRMAKVSIFSHLPCVLSELTKLFYLGTNAREMLDVVWAK